MFNDDFWQYLAIAGVGIGAYLAGKNKGFNQAVHECSIHEQLRNQQNLIQELQSKLNQFENTKLLS